MTLDKIACYVSLRDKLAPECLVLREKETSRLLVDTNGRLYDPYACEANQILQPLTPDDKMLRIKALKRVAPDVFQKSDLGYVITGSEFECLSDSIIVKTPETAVVKYMGYLGQELDPKGVNMKALLRDYSASYRTVNICLDEVKDRMEKIKSGLHKSRIPEEYLIREFRSIMDRDRGSQLEQDALFWFAIMMAELDIKYGAVCNL